jgi:NADPH2:quinone reductase
MRAAIYQQPGAVNDVLEVTDVPTPEPGPGEVRVRIEFTGLNPTDWKRMRTGPLAGAFQVPCQDGAGTIDAVGTGVDPSRVGERVWLLLAAADNQWGALAEYSVVKSEQAIVLNAAASFELGASLGVPVMTAWHCLCADGPITGMTVLVAGGAGAVGHAAIQLAKFAGAREVIATVSNDEKAVIAAQAGADTIVNYRADGVVDQIRAAAPNGVDRVVEVDLAANASLDLAVVAEHAVISSYAATDESVAHLPVRALMAANVLLRFSLLYSITRADMAAAIGGVQEAVAAQALGGLPFHVFPLDRAAEALTAVQEGAVGKVLVGAPQTS